MDITGKLNKFITEDVITQNDIQSDLMLIETIELKRVIDKIEATVKELEDNKEISIDVLKGFKDLSIHMQSMVDKPVPALSEKLYGFGKNGTVEVYGNTVVINKDGRSVEMTKQELIDILLKAGLAKKK